MMERQLVYLALQHGGATIDSGEQNFLCAKVGLFQQKKKTKKKTYVCLRRKVALG